MPGWLLLYVPLRVCQWVLSWAFGQTTMDDLGQVLTFVVDEHTAGDRLDRFVVAKTGRGRVQVRRLLDAGRVHVGNRVQKKAYLVQPADVVTIRMWPDQVAHDGELVLVTVRDDLVIADKPSGLPTAAVRDEVSDTLAARLLARFPEMAEVGYGKREPGVLHRLDNDTTGLVVAARNQATFETLRCSMDAGLWSKQYLCLVHGRLESTTVQRGLAPDPKSARRVVVLDDAHPAADHIPTTVFEALRVIETTLPADGLSRSSEMSDALGTFTFARATITKGYRHQIRAHAAALGHPLVGDTRYRAAVDQMAARALGLEVDGHLLHAAEVTFPDPAYPDAQMSAVASMPKWVRAIASH